MAGGRKTGRSVRGVCGRDRAVLYRLAVGTGFRAGELASLTPESFDLDADPPTVTILAAYSKRRHRRRKRNRRKNRPEPLERPIRHRQHKQRI